MPDYWKDARSVLTGSQTINIPTVANSDKKKVIYVDGDATITNNIVYSGSGSWTNLNDIPAFYLIVKGNIHINRSVTTLDGVYVALPRDDGSKGTIYTCTNGSAPYTGSIPATAAGCSNKLTINGAFVAKHVKFLRTNGDVAAAVANEPRSSPNIAEVFIYGPELWISPNAGANPERKLDSWNSIVNLPPVL